MKKVLSITMAAFFLVALAVASDAGEKMMGVKPLPKEKQIKIAQSAAPLSISKDATIMVFGEDGKLVEAKKGTNGFTCIPDIEAQEVPDPICLDAAGWQWLNDAMAGAPKPTNTMPGIAYMAKGGFHWEKDGKILPTTKSEPGAKRVKEPPHWMVLGSFDSKTSGLPSLPGKLGTYIMYDGTPYSHLMIYQNPNKMK